MQILAIGVVVKGRDIFSFPEITNIPWIRKITPAHSGMGLHKGGLGRVAQQVLKGELQDDYLRQCKSLALFNKNHFLIHTYSRTIDAMQALVVLTNFLF
jgi:hypothetical protein